MSYYHYTIGCHLGSIVKEGKINTMDVPWEMNKEPVTWLSKSSVWDVACNVDVVVNHQELVDGEVYCFDEIETITASNKYMRIKVGMCRIVLSEKLTTITWAKYKHVSGISEDDYYAIDKYSRSDGSQVNDWLFTFGAIAEKYWEGIEMYVGNQWVRWDDTVPIDEFIELCLSCNN